MKLVNLIVIRHGETAHNQPPRIFQGHLDTSLNESGFKQAELVCERLKNISITHQVQWDRIYCSDLQRARQTLQPLLLHQPELQIKTQYDSRIKEQDAGDLTGVPVSEASKLLSPEETFHQFIARTGESDTKIRERVQDWLLESLDEALKNYDASPYNIIAMTHGGVIRCLWQLLLPNIKFCAAKNTGLYHFAFSIPINLSTVPLRQLRKTQALQAVNCVHHLKEEIFPNGEFHLNSSEYYLNLISPSQAIQPSSAFLTKDSLYYV